MPDPKRIPTFASDEEAAEFWDAHSTADYTAELEPAPDIRFSIQNLKQISLRLSPKQISSLKLISTRKGIGYQTMVRMWIAERLQQEEAAVGKQATGV